MISHQWQPIRPLSENCEYDFSAIDSLQRQWIAYRQAREEYEPAAYSAFLERLHRSWAIETGIIEGLYTLDRGMTETLVMHGISADLIERQTTNKDPVELAAILDDHSNAVDGIYAEIRDGRPISRSAIRQIHQTMTRHQPTYRAMNQFGQWFDAELNRGEFKKLPNNPTRPDRAVHEYCPPEHVDSEIDNLLEWYSQYVQDTDRYHPLLTGAWLHHRFTQIHPFQDGNGRVVRALLSWHLVREGYLPVVVKRDDRVDYIDALEKADDGDLVPFVDLLVRMQRQTILEAVSEPDFDESTGSVDQVLARIVGRVNCQDAPSVAQMREVNTVAQALHDESAALLMEWSGRIASQIPQAGRTVSLRILKGGRRRRDEWHRYQVEQTAKNSRHWVNFSESRFCVRLTMMPGLTSSRTPRLDFVLSLHHVGRQLTGIMAATAFAWIGYYGAKNPGQFIDCTLEPFIFTWESDADALLSRFEAWIDLSLATALQGWGNHFA